jgi:hypothetical protein
MFHLFQDVIFFAAGAACAWYATHRTIATSVAETVGAVLGTVKSDVSKVATTVEKDI